MNTRTPLYQTVAHHTHTHISYNKGLKTLNSNKLITAVYPITLVKRFPPPPLKISHQFKP